jgi:UDP-N-acetylglucosamine 2-epimerase (non-hydrolysing)
VKIVNVVGARPNFVKIAPLLAEMRRHPSVQATLIHTGQHYDLQMSARFFDDLEIPASDVNLGVGSSSHAAQTGEVMRRLEPILIGERPDVVVVVGDVNSTLAAALTAVKLGIPVAHVEAGLRSFDRAMPEEINRVLTDAIAELLFVTEESGRQNLLREGIAPGKIHFVGNVMIDALERCRPRWERSAIWSRLGFGPESPYAVLTLHRPSNVDDPLLLRKFIDAVQELGRHLPIVFPVHPRLQQRLSRLDLLPPAAGVWPSATGITWLEPLGYIDFVALVSRARLVLTDSGGIQEETTALGIPCLTLRDTTERPVTVSHGTNQIIGSNPGHLLEKALRTVARPPRPNGRPPGWDGRASERIVKILLSQTDGGMDDET